MRLRVVGNPLGDHEWRLIDALSIRKLISEAGRVSDEDLQAEYRHAEFFIFPSLMEGFGLPLLEAQLNGCPVLCSDIPAFREVAGNAAVYFDPRLSESLVAAVAGFMQSTDSQDLRALGYANATRYDWDRTAAATLRVYEQLAASPVTGACQSMERLEFA